MKKPERIFMTALAAACFAGAMPAFADASDQAVLEASRHFANRDYEKVVAVLKGIPQSESNAALAHRLLGCAYQELGRHSEARAAFAAALSQGDLSTGILDGLIQCDYEQDRRHTLPVALGLRVLADPANTVWALAYADVLTLNNRHDEAETVCEAILKLAPENIQAFIGLGNSYLVRSDNEKAVVAFESAYWLGSPNTELAERIAEIWYGLGDTQAAVLWYDRAVGAASKPSASTQMRAAELRMAGGDTEKGMAELERLAESPDTGVAGRALFLLGHAALRRDQEVTALKYFREAVKKDYAQPDIIAYVAADLIRQGEPVKAAGLIEEHDSILPFNAAVEETLVTGLIQAGRPDLAERHLLRHLERRGLDEHAQRMLAMLSEAQTAQ